MSKEVIKLGDAYKNDKHIGGNGRGAIYDINGICATLLTMIGSGNKPFVISRIDEREKIDNMTKLKELKDKKVTIKDSNHICEY